MTAIMGRQRENIRRLSCALNQVIWCYAFVRAAAPVPPAGDGREASEWDAHWKSNDNKVVIWLEPQLNKRRM